jgi:predicted transcriptional regulator
MPMRRVLRFQLLGMARLAGRIGGRRKGMIAVLISIRPKWCEKIISGEKTIEVRKTRPKLIPQFKCYIYCTLPKYPHEDFIATDYPRPQFYGGGKVIGEFTCNRVTNLFSNSRFWLDEDDVLHTCLSAAEMRKYANGARGLYGWHISDLRVYDHPRDLWEFIGLRQTRFGWEPVPITRPPQSWRYVEEEIWND